MADLQSTNGRLRELALFAGAGGGILGGQLLGWRTVCAVERDAYAASVLVARQNDGVLEPFPIWSDVETFDGRELRGLVDVVSGGFPCTDISCAGKGAGIDGDASGLWREMARIVGEVRPRFVFVENSPMLVRRGLARVISDFASLGYDARWCCVSADDVGAPHLRDRIWILANAKEQYRSGLEQETSVFGRSCEDMADTKVIAERSGLCEGKQEEIRRGRSGNGSCTVSNADKGGCEGIGKPKLEGSKANAGTSLTDAVNGGQGKRSGQLNPPWVEWLMGWPINWTSLNKMCYYEFSIWRFSHEEKFRSQSCTADDEGYEMRDMWWGKDPSEASQRWESVKQLSFKLDGSLPEVSHNCPYVEQHMGKGEGIRVEMQGLRFNISPKKEQKQCSLWSYRMPCRMGKKISRVAVGVKNRIDRIRCLGNGQVPRVAAAAWRILTDESA